MNFINPPENAPENITHKAFFSKLIGHEIGYNIYLPPGYADGGKRHPVAYHLHGYRCNESSDLQALEGVCRAREAITVFVNATAENGYLDGVLPMESFIITELIPFIDSEYRTLASREHRSLSGFSMGGAGAFYYAAKYPELFSAVTAYAGTYHHFYHKSARTVGVAIEEAAGIFATMMREKRYLEEDGIMCLVRQNSENIRDKVRIVLHVGSNDGLLCDNEIMHLYLNSLNIPHEYRLFDGAGHKLDKII